MGITMKKKITTIAHHKEKNNRVFALLLVVILALFFIRLKYVNAASSPWTQTDWSGGSGSSTTNQYVSVSDIDALTTSGEFYLDEISGWPEDFANWQYRKKITFDNTNSNLGVTSENLTNFPVLIKLDSGSDIDYSKIQDEGQDLRFSDSDGTVLNYEIEKWDEAGSSYVWVSVPQINSNSDTDFIYTYYGNSGATDDQNATSVWNSNYKMVQHLEETSGTTTDDSTTNNNDGSKVSSTEPSPTTSGQIGSAQTFDGLNDFIQTPFAPSGFTAISFSVWANLTAVGSYPMVMSYGTNGDNVTELRYQGGSGYIEFVRRSDNVGVLGNANLSGTGWHYFVGTTNGTTFSLYKDGVLVNSYTGAHNINAATTLRLGQRSDGSYFFTGSIDEARVADSVLTPAWVAASYKSETDDYIAYGSEELRYPASGTLVSNIFDAGFEADWGTLSYTTAGLGTTTVKVRTSNSATMVGATDWASCAAKSSGADLTGGCVTDSRRYVQYQVTLEPSGATSPTFSSISIAFTASDQIRPTTNATVVEVADATGDDWVNEEPVINWIDGADNVGGVGILGYCISLDETNIASASTGLDPEITSGLLTGIDDGISNAACPYIVGDNSIDLASVSGLTLTVNKKYYVSLKAVDSAGNVFTGDASDYQDLTNFKYDPSLPTNVAYVSMPSGSFSNVTDMLFSWPTTGVNGPSDVGAGVLGYQYQINSTSGTWLGTEASSDCALDYIPLATGSYTLTVAQDSPNIVVGNNVIYFRTVDSACNTSSSASYRTGNLSYGGAAPTFATSCDSTTGVTVTPSTSTSNSFALAWGAATPAGGRTLTNYYYMVNTSPPSSLSTITSNTSTYLDNGTVRTVTADVLTGSVKGSNTVYVVGVDDADNYSASNCIKGTYTLDSSLPDAPLSVSVSDASIKESELWRASLAWSAPAYKGTGSLTYKIQRSTDDSTWATVTTTTGNAYVDTVDDSALYYWRIGVSDTSAESIATPTWATSISLTPKGAFDDAPGLSSGPTVTSITTRQATITWSTSRDADSKIQYGKKSGDYYDEQPSKSEQSTDHEIVLTNLSPGTTYYYKALWTDEDGNTGTSDEKSFKTDPPPVVTEPRARSIGINSAIISFTVKDAEKVKVYYGKNTSFDGNVQISTSQSLSSQNTLLGGLSDDSKYYFKINSFDSEGEEYEGNILSFQTLPSPRISNLRIQQAKNTAQSTAVISWVTNTEISSIVTYYPQGNPSAVRDEVNIALTKGEHKMILRGLSPSARYELKVSGRDIAGNEAESDLQYFTTATDTRPAVIENLKVEGVSKIEGQTSKSQLIISWNTDEAATSQVEFGEGTGTTYGQKSQEDANLTFNHLVVLSGLTPSKVYHLRAISKDKAGNITQSIDIVTITPKATENALDLVVSSLKEVFGFIPR